MTTPHRLYVGTIGEGLFRSLDGGATFARACNGMFVECHVRALSVHPRDQSTLYLGSEQGLYRSTDGAENWTRVDSPLDGLQIWSILISPHEPDRILVGTCPSRLFLSENAGRTWSEPSVDFVRDCPRIIHTRVTTLASDPENPKIFWAGVEIGGLRRSRDGGHSWEAIGQGLSSQDIHAVVIVTSKGRPRRMLASTNNDVNLSTDDGATWQPLGLKSVLPSPYFRTLAQPCGQPEVVLLGNGDFPPGSVGTVARSLDGGQNWQATCFPAPANSTLWNFAVYPTDPTLIYASSVSGEVYRSTDSGASWLKIMREFGEIRALAWTP